MSATRACRRCRDAKIKCDMRRPTCGACIQRGVTCEGYASESDYLFRDQNETARANSERARRQRTQSMDPVAIVLATPRAGSSRDHDQTALIYCKAMPWLNQQACISIYGSLTSTLQERARHIFYSEWILYPCNHGASPGYLDILPAVEAQMTATPALHLAVDAFALANIQNFTISNGNLRDMAMTRYGEALAAVREAIAEGSLETDDSILLAILIIDTFEVIFMKREEPLGLHRRAIEHILTVRGAGNIYSPGRFSLYRMAYHRLQNRQLILGQDPLPVQLECVKSLNTSEAALGLSEILLRAQEALHISQELLTNVLSNSVDAEEQALTVMRRLKQSLDELELWSTRVAPSWQPRYLQVAEHDDIQQLFAAASLPSVSQVRLYHDPWIAYEMNFFYQGQLVLRSAIVDTLAWITEITSDAVKSQAWTQEAEGQMNMVADCADALIESVPILIGSTELRGPEIDFCGGKKISHLFARAACWTLQQGKHVPLKHKDFANKALLWLQQSESRD